MFVRRHESFDLNVGLVVADGACLVIDTRSTPEEAADLIAAVREVTPAPWTVVNTHAHFDHCFGNRDFAPAEIWAHEGCAASLRRYGEVQRAVARRTALEGGRRDLAEGLAEVVIVPPDRLIRHRTEIEVGERTLVLQHLGRGHTDHDLIVHVPDSEVVFAGDLVEEGAAPQFDDGFPLEWPHTLQRLLPLLTGPVVPGHGDVVGRAFVEGQLADLAEAAATACRANGEGLGADAIVPLLDFPEPTSRILVERALRQLRGEPDYDPPERILEATGLTLA
ncbi:MAG TPA: MBL fold metallo-hydrolase [Candidatus Dormibacteraeota bacterium]|nr:MBL fold metallo-hydrolase [Candidatus Dormibacteraeota bacterium]